MRYFTFTTNKFHILFDNEKYCITSFFISHQTFYNAYVHIYKHAKNSHLERTRKCDKVCKLRISSSTSIYRSFTADIEIEKVLEKEKRIKKNSRIPYTRFARYRCVQSFTVDMDSQGRKEITRRIRI